MEKIDVVDKKIHIYTWFKFNRMDILVKQSNEIYTL